MSDTAEKRPTIRIRFKGNKPGKVSGSMPRSDRSHGQFRFKFEGAGPFEVAKEEYELYLEGTGFFEIAQDKAAGGQQQQSGGQQAQQ